MVMLQPAAPALMSSTAVPPLVLIRAHVGVIDALAFTFDGSVGESTDGIAALAPDANGEPIVKVAPSVPVAPVSGPAGCVPSRISIVPALPTAVVIASSFACIQACE